MKRSKKNTGSVLVEYLMLTAAVVTAGGAAAKALMEAHAELVQRLLDSVHSFMGG